jgi:ribose-phosphate pyrophosphokinase
MKIFSGKSNETLAQQISWSSGAELGNVYLHTFPSGEKYCQFKDNIRGDDIFLVQSTSSPANDNLMELLVMSDAARRASAGRITAVIPYFGYSRQDRKEKSRVPISARLVMDLLQAAGINRILTMDLHAAQIGGFTNLPVDHLYFQPVLAQHIRKQYHNLALRDKIVVVAPDVGAVKRGEQFSELMGTDFAFISKKRINDTKVELNNFVGDVKGKIALIIDDMTESCGTMLQAAKVCKENGADKVICAVSHFCFTETGMERLAISMPHPNMPDAVPVIDEFIHSNSVKLWWSKKYKPANITELDISPLFGDAISRINSNKSVSDLFQ